MYITVLTSLSVDKGCGQQMLNIQNKKAFYSVEAVCHLCFRSVTGYSHIGIFTTWSAQQCAVEQHICGFPVSSTVILKDRVYLIPVLRMHFFVVDFAPLTSCGSQHSRALLAQNFQQMFDAESMMCAADPRHDDTSPPHSCSATKCRHKEVDE